MPIRDSEHEPESVKLNHLAGNKQSVAFFDKRKLVPQLAYELGFRHKASLYDATITLGAGDDDPHDVCYDPDRNMIWIVCLTTPGRILRVNPETLAIDRIIMPGGINQGYRVCYDGKWIWATMVDTPNSTVVRVNPDTMAYTYVTVPYQYANALCIGGRRNGIRYAFVGVQTHILRFNPDTFPAYDVVDISGQPAPDWLQVREVVDDGTGRLWIIGGHAWGGCRVAWMDVDTLAVTQIGVLNGTAYGFSGCWDGSYLWIGDGIGQLIKFNPDTYAFDILRLRPSYTGGDAYVHGIQFDGKYLHIVEYHNGYYYIVHPETMEYSVHETLLVGRHNLCFDSTNIWMVCAISSPGTVERFLVHEPSRRVEHGQTGTVDVSSTGQKTIAVTFDLPFSRVPIVVVSLNDIVSAAAIITNVEANTVTVNGFTASCNVHVAGAGGSTTRFMWIATERSTHHP